MNDIRASLERRRGDVERARAIEGGPYAVEGLIRLIGTGEIMAPVLFPVTFTKLPVLDGGGFTDDGQIITPGLRPEWKVNVHRWDTITRPGHPGVLWYRGATLVIILDGGSGTTFRSTAWWRAAGPALMNPIVGGL